MCVLTTHALAFFVVGESESETHDELHGEGGSGMCFKAFF